MKLTSLPHTPTQIVILGGGYVGVLAYKSLASRLRRQLDRGDVQITVVCPLLHHTFHGWTAESLTGILQTKNQLSPLADLMPKARLVLGQAEALDPTWNTVKVRSADGSVQRFYYDHLLMGIGSFDSDAVEGVREYGYQVKSREAFHRTQAAIYRLVQRAAQTSEPAARQLLTFTLAGGGFTGVELATNLAEYVRVLKNRHPSLRNVEPQIRLVHGGERVLEALPAGCCRLVRYAEKTMVQWGIRVICNRRTIKVTPEGVYLDDDTFLPGSMFISTVGQCRVLLKGTERLKRDAGGRLYTNDNLQLLEYDNIWGGGDACHVKRYKTNKACPSNALWAIKHGEHAGKNIARVITGQAPKPFTFKGLGEAASLGIGKGIGELYGLQFTGPLAWVLRWFFFHYFMPSRKVMLRSMADWMFLLFRGQRKGVLSLQQTEAVPSAPSFIISEAVQSIA